MRKKINIFCTLAVPAFLFFSSCANNKLPEINAEMIEGRKVFKELQEFLTISPRQSGTENSAKAARYILAKLRSYGLISEIDYFEDNTPVGVIGFRNVIGEIRGGSKKIIIIGSHYDTKAGISPDFQGANDSGSSTAILLELARIVSLNYKNLERNNKRLLEKMPTIVFAVFDGEECKIEYSSNDGLHGSCRMVEKLVKNQELQNVLAMVLLDMVGDKNLKIEIPPNSSGKLMKMTFDAARKVDFRQYFTIGKEAILDDHVPFLQAGVPAIVLIDFHYGSSPEKNDYWHTTNDTIDKISEKSLEIVGKVAIELINGIVQEALRDRDSE